MTQLNEVNIDEALTILSSKEEDELLAGLVIEQDEFNFMN